MTTPDQIALNNWNAVQAYIRREISAQEFGRLVRSNAELAQSQGQAQAASLAYRELCWRNNNPWAKSR